MSAIGKAALLEAIERRGRLEAQLVMVECWSRRADGQLERTVEDWWPEDVTALPAWGTA